MRVLLRAMDLAKYMPVYASYSEITFVSLLTKGHVEMVNIVGIATYLAKVKCDWHRIGCGKLISLSVGCRCSTRLRISQGKQGM